MARPVQEAASKQLDDEVRSLRQPFPGAEGILRTGLAWEQVLAVIQEGATDLVVMGTYGRQGLRHALLGSVTERVVRLSPAPVLTVHAPPAVSAEA